MDTSAYQYPPTPQEVTSLIAQLVQSQYFPMASQYLFPELSISQLRDLLAPVSDVDHFQRSFMFRFCQYIVDNTISSLSSDGQPSATGSLFLSNHRDIVLDAVLLQYLRLRNGTPATHVVIGANLFEMELMRLLARLNKMHPIPRGGNSREFYSALANLSQWIRARVGENQSVWLAQRNGRTKDGLDRTDEAVVKMLALSGDRNDPLSALASLNITPMAISYEWEPCAIQKARELALKQLNGSYTKSPGEDSQSIVSGVLSPKGRVHIALGVPLSRTDLLPTGGNPLRVAQLLDTRISHAYRLWPNNYIAADLLDNSTAHASHYTPDQRQTFLAYLDKASADNPLPPFRQILLAIYANPVIKPET